jgi:abortive infection protein abiGII
MEIRKRELLISYLIGVDMRSTMDMDTTLRGIPLSEATISKILDEILELFQESKMMEILWRKYTQNAAADLFYLHNQGENL